MGSFAAVDSATAARSFALGAVASRGALSAAGSFARFAFVFPGCACDQPHSGANKVNRDTKAMNLCIASSYSTLFRGDTTAGDWFPFSGRLHLIQADSTSLVNLL